MKRLYFFTFVFFCLSTVNAQIFYEGFDGASFPPEGWLIETTNTNNTWNIFDGGFDNTDNAVQVWFDETENQDEALITPSIDLSSCSSPKLIFGSMTFYDYISSFDVSCLVSVDGGNTWSKIWDENELVENEGSFNPIPYTIEEDLYEFAGNSDVKIKFHYVGVNGAQWVIDEIKIIDFVAAPDVALSNDKFVVYPNPIKDFININLPESLNAKNVTVTITNTSGKQVANFKDTRNLSVSDLPAGMYFVSINDGVIFETVKIIKE